MLRTRLTADEMRERRQGAHDGRKDGIAHMVRHSGSKVRLARSAHRHDATPGCFYNDAYRDAFQTVVDAG